MGDVIKTPCVRMCTLNEADMCLGCGRKLTEITSWAAYTSEQRDRIIHDCPRRLADNKTSALLNDE